MPRGSKNNASRNGNGEYLQYTHSISIYTYEQTKYKHIKITICKNRTSKADNIVHHIKYPTIVLLFLLLLLLLIKGLNMDDLIWRSCRSWWVTSLNLNVIWVKRIKEDHHYSNPQKWNELWSLLRAQPHLSLLTLLHSIYLHAVPPASSSAHICIITIHVLVQVSSTGEQNPVIMHAFTLKMCPYSMV